jgi:hypothetical protein
MDIRLTDALALTRLKAVNKKIAGMPEGKERLALLREQAALGDQRDVAADKRRRAAYE